jgi:uncharacterized protein
MARSLPDARARSYCKKAGIRTREEGRPSAPTGLDPGVPVDDPSCRDTLPKPTIITASCARRLLLGGQGLLDDPTRKATRQTLMDLILKLGFVQIDSINVVARAHDLTLHSRMDGYDPRHLDTLLCKERRLFEHWTHDASFIPTEWYAHWKPRFRRDRGWILTHPWWRSRVGRDADRILDLVRGRIAAEGPLRSADFEHAGPREPWWGWKPAKAALDFLWRTGELAIAGRDGFQKIYDLAERVLPEPCACVEPDPGAHIEWVCASAAQRLVLFTPRELGAFWDCLDLPTVKTWCAQGVKMGRLEPVLIENADASKPQAAFALADWQALAGALAEPAQRIRLLCPFDPVVRDRARCLRRFGFDYRFEAFVPAGKRQYGYYVFPILEGERFIGRLDAKHHRDRGLLDVRGLWWERGVRPSKRRLRSLQAALQRLSSFVGAANLEGPGADVR